MSTSPQTLIQIVQRHRLTTGEVPFENYKLIYGNYPNINYHKNAKKTLIYFRVWKTTRKHNPRLRIHLVTEGRHKNEIMFQQKAPVKSIVYDTPYNKVNDDVIMFDYIILDLMFKPSFNCDRACLFIFR